MIGKALQTRRIPSNALRHAAVLSLLLFLALLAYCFGHGLITSEPLYLRASLAFSLSHAFGFGCGVLLLIKAGFTNLIARFVAILAVSVAASGVAYWILMLGSEATILHKYNSLIVYALAALALNLWIRPAAVPPLLKVDFGKQRRLVNAREIVAVTGAKNYAEVFVSGQDRPGLVRSTLSDLEKTLQFPGSTILRAHRSHLVAAAAVTAIHAEPRGALELIVDGRHAVPVSPRYAEAVRQACTRVLFQRENGD